MPVYTSRPMTSSATASRKTDQSLPLYARQAPVQVRHSISPGSATGSVAPSTVPSLTNGGTNSVGSRSHDSDGHHGVDLIEMMTDRLHLAANPEPLDRTIAKQAQT